MVKCIQATPQNGRGFAQIARSSSVIKGGFRVQ